MQFNSYFFVFVFLPTSVIIYFIANKINDWLGKIMLILSGIIFYTYARYDMFMILFLSLLTNYAFNRILYKIKSGRKVCYVMSILVNIVFLFYFKYLNFGITSINSIFGTSFAIKNIILPLGISFYTFQQIAFVTSIYRGEILFNALDYFAFILFFPKILMGPLMDPKDFCEQINNPNKKIICMNNIASGFMLFTYGLLKKVLLADAFSKAVTWGHEYHDYLSAIDIILIMLFYTFEIYFDFSGYSDMAVGISKMFNIDLPINFNSPYKATSIRDFWKRWHISLTKFFTKYVYIPLGGSKKGEIITYVNVMFVFLLSGLWHGANWTFILWGFFHGIFSILDRYLEKKKISFFEPFRWLLTQGIISILWLLFDADSISQWLNMLKSVINADNMTISQELSNAFNLPECRFVFDVLHVTNLYFTISNFSMYVFIIVASFICFVPENNNKRYLKLTPLSMICTSIAFVWGVLCLGGVSSFVYHGF